LDGRPGIRYAALMAPDSIPNSSDTASAAPTLPPAAPPKGKGLSNEERSAEAAFSRWVHGVGLLLRRAAVLAAVVGLLFVGVESALVPAVAKLRDYPKE